jgi:hypothetical protein
MKVICNNCKKERDLSVPNQKKLVEKFGSEEKLKKGYLCRGCKKELKTIQKKKKE